MLVTAVSSKSRGEAGPFEPEAVKAEEKRVLGTGFGAPPRAVLTLNQLTNFLVLCKNLQSSPKSQQEDRVPYVKSKSLYFASLQTRSLCMSNVLE